MAGIQIPYERILETVQQKSGLSKEELEVKIDAKLKQLSGLISKQGAAHIVANELGVKLVEQISGKFKIGSILAGMRDVETEGRVVQVYEARTFETERGTGKVASFILGDDTGTIRVVLWNNQVDKATQLAENMPVRVLGGYTRMRKDQRGNDRVEVHLNDRSKLILNAPGIEVAEIKPRFSRKKIRDITPEDEQVEVLGTIYQVFDPRFFEVCPQCGRRVRMQEEVFKCETHGNVTPDYSYVMNLFLDDGSSTIRLVCFREQALRLLTKSNEEFLSYREAPESFESVKNDLLGQIIKVIGRVTKNEMFDRLELIAQIIYPNPDPQEELKRLQSEVDKQDGQDHAQEQQPQEKTATEPQQEQPQQSQQEGQDQAQEQQPQEKTATEPQQEQPQQSQQEPVETAQEEQPKTPLQPEPEASHEPQTDSSEQVQF